MIRGLGGCDRHIAGGDDGVGSFPVADRSFCNIVEGIRRVHSDLHELRRRVADSRNKLLLLNVCLLCVHGVCGFGKVVPYYLS